MTEAQATLYDQNGFPLHDFISNFERSWVLNDWGECRFYVAISELVSHPEFFEIGNFLLVQQTDWPDWIGYIDTPQQHGNKAVSFSAYSAERLLVQRPAKNKHLIKGTSGVIFSKLINQYNIWEKSRIFLGDIYTRGTKRQKFIDPSKLLLDVIIQLSNKSKNDFDITPAFMKGRLRLEANWYRTKDTIQRYALIEGFNIDQGSVAIEYEGDIYTAVFAYGNERTWKDKETFYVEDPDTKDQYGLRILPLYVDDNALATIKKAAKSALRRYKNPHIRLEFFCTANSFPYLRTGNILDVEIYSIGFQDGQIGISTRLRIVEIIYQHLENIARVIAEVYYG